MSDLQDHSSNGRTRVVLVTGASGAGRSTAINALEDLGFEAIDNLPLSLVERLLDGPPPSAPLALGIDVRNRDFSSDGMVALLDALSADPDIDAELLYLDCRTDVLIRRYSETRRRHPLAPSESPDIGIAREMELLIPVRTRADRLIETSELTVHDLKAEIGEKFGTEASARLAISVESFSFKRGLPRGADMVMDVRFLANPHWEEGLRDLDGRTAEVQAFVAGDPRFKNFFARTVELTQSLLPAFKDEGKTSLTLAFGCTGGKHRSVALAEKTAKALAAAGWQVSTRHRELERRGLASNGESRA
ncbi:MAG: RNase adapter RapZ [Boseongicola sp.]|nr:RNase adapter RapZ [Boseongicola sp.]NNL17881.1 RNase adapter RapZ [Boseongicola sp.]